MRRPDRIALWAVGIAVVGMIAAAASAHGAMRPHAQLHAGTTHDIRAAAITK